MERKIGETFEYKGKKLKVVQTAKDLCFDCYFFDGVNCQRAEREGGECSKSKRTDHNSAIFMEVKDEQPQEQTEQPQELNLCEILKHCPKGERFWSPMLGDVKFSFIDEERQMIFVETIKGLFTCEINADGTISIDEVTSPEIMLHPSREQRDWSKFTAPWYNKEESIKPKFKVGDIIRHKETNKDDVYEISKVYDDSYGIVGFNWGIYMEYQDQYELVPNKFDPNTLKPFDKVLSRYDGGCWSANLFSHIEEENNKYHGTCSFVCNGSLVRFCIPYNEETKHLVGTKDEAPDFYRYWEN